MTSHSTRQTPVRNKSVKKGEINQAFTVSSAKEKASSEGKGVESARSIALGGAKHEIKSKNIKFKDTLAVEMDQMKSLSNSEPQVMTKSTVRVDADDIENRYQSSHIFFYVHIAFFSICGCLCRIGSDAIFGSVANIEDPGEIINQAFFSNMLGSFILGALNGSPMGKTRLVSLYKGLTTGFCGCLTTWSKWNQQLSLLLVGETRTESQPQVLSVASWFIGFYSYLGSYKVGIDFGKHIGGKIGKHVSQNGPKISDVCVSALLILSILGFAVGVAFDATQTGKEIWLSVLLAPFGACLRFWLSPLKIEKFKIPLGTLLANVSGAVALSLIHVVNVHVANEACGENWSVCWPTIITFAVGTGFCACFTTVSTFMGEVHSLRPEHPKFGYFYAIVTVTICQTLCGIINGVNYTMTVNGEPMPTLEPNLETTAKI